MVAFPTQNSSRMPAKARLAGLIILAQLTSFSCCALAAELTLEECIAQALARNNRIKSTEMKLAAAREDVRIARTGFLPLLQARGSFTLTDSPDRLIIDSNAIAPGVPAQDASIATGDRDQYALSLVVRQPLFTGGNLTHLLGRAKAQGDEARYRLESQKKLLISQVKRLFNEALNEKMQQMTVAKLVQAKRERLRVFRERFAEGYLEQEDLLLQEADLSFTEAELSRCGNRAALALTRLRLLMQQPAEEALVLKGKPLNVRLVIPLGDALQAGITNREDLKSSLEQVRGAEEEVGMAKSAWFPQASLSGSYTRQKETNIARPEVWLLAAQLDWQLFDWGRVRSAVRRTAALQQEKIYQHEELKKNVLIEVEELWRGAQDREQVVKALEKRVKSEEYRVGRVVEKYGEGTVKLTEVLDAEAQLVKACNEYLVALNDSASLLAQFEAAVSVPIAGWLVEENVYLPDLTVSASRLKFLVSLRNRQEGAALPVEAKQSGTHQLDPAGVPGISQSAAAAPASVAPPGASAVLPGPVAGSPAGRGTAVEVQAAARVAHASKGIFLQLGAFKSRKYATVLKDTVSAVAGDHSLRILIEGGFYKVVLGRFGSKKEAETWAQHSGIKEYQARSDGGF